MKIRIKFNLILKLTSNLSLGLGITIVLAQANFAAELPQSIKACIPVIQVAKVEIVATAQKLTTTYYLMNAYESGDPVPSDLMIAVSHQKCSLLLYNPMNDVIPLSRFAPLDVARQLALQKLQIAVRQAGGKEQFQQKLLAESAQIGVNYWTPEYFWALQQLSISPPSNSKVVPPESIKVSPEP